MSLAAAALLLVGATAGRTEPPERRPGGTIVFSRESAQGNPGIFLMDVRTGTERRIAANAYEPAPSPDGKRIAIVRDGDIWVMSRDGFGQRRITAGLREDFSPAWSADGRTIFFSGGGKGSESSQLYKIRADGTQGRRLTRPREGECELDPQPAHDGRIVAYTAISDCRHGAGRWIRAITVDGEAVSVLDKLR